MLLIILKALRYLFGVVAGLTLGWWLYSDPTRSESDFAAVALLASGFGILAACYLRWVRKVRPSPWWVYFFGMVIDCSLFFDPPQEWMKWLGATCLAMAALALPLVMATVAITDYLRTSGKSL